MVKEEYPTCCRCFEDFPTATEPVSWRMGVLRRLSRASKKVRMQVGYARRGAYLCGNCWFNLTDEDPL